jgi:nucleotide-binding universal stress UspA family protein
MIQLARRSVQGSSYATLTRRCPASTRPATLNGHAVLVLNKVLVPLDGSALAERALAYATALSIPTAARLVLVRAVNVLPLADLDTRELQIRALAEAQHYLRDVAQGLADRGFACETATPYGESPARWIVKEAHLRACDMIVMTTHGRTGPGRWWFGSVAEEVVAHSPVPVLLDRAWHPWQRALLLEDGPRLLVPLDESPLDAAALHVAARLAEDLGGELILIHVDPRAADVMTADQAVAEFAGEPDVLADDESAYLKDVAASVLRNWPGVSVRTRLGFGSPAEAIALAAAETNAGLVVMATHGRTGLPRAVVGSVAGRLLEFDTVPLVLVNPAAHDQFTGVAEHGVAHASRS